MSCLQDTYFWLHHNSDHNNFTIVHAIVERRTDGLRHPHAVIYNRTTGNIHEVSNDFKDDNVIMPFMMWILLGKVSDIKQYEFLEINKIIVETAMWDFYHLT